jgi:hypothetical protein
VPGARGSRPTLCGRPADIVAQQGGLGHRLIWGIDVVTAYVAVTAITAVANTCIAIAGWSRARFVVANAADVGVPQSWLPFLAALKAAGAAGLVLGLMGVQLVGIAAATGLVLFFVGAVAAHVRARAYQKIAFPGCFLVLAIACLALAAAQ